jgi:serine/arginine repetitive matrix protein 2
LEQVESLASNLKEELEVVDFLDMGKFVGVTDVPPTPIAKSKQVFGSQSSRPVASDFFDDEPELLDLSDTKIVAWRQRLSHEVLHERDGINSAAQDNQSGTGSNTLPTFESSISTKTIDHHVQAVAAPTPGVSGRNPRNQTFYKVATMSALDDVMSRIKGALDGMQTSEATKEVPSPESDSSTVKSSVPRSSGRPNSQKDRWVPPPLRLQNYDRELHEEPVTGFEPPRSPKPAWNAFVVRLPRTTRVLEPIHKKQLTLFSKPVYQARWDILSFDPPVEGMNRRDFTLNDILFGKPSRYRGQPKYRVVLPKLEPRVNIPSHTFSPKTSGGGAFGRPGGADGVATWRKPASAKPLPDDTTPQPGLDTLSRSPPPDTLPANSSVTSLPVLDSLDSLKADGLVSTRPRLQPKMPAGSAVAFYRDSRIDAVEADLKPSVNFIVTSELEELRQTTPVKVKPSITVTSPVTIRPSTESDSVRGVKSLINGVITPHSTENAMSSMTLNKAESKSSEDSVSVIASRSTAYMSAKLSPRLTTFQSLRLAITIPHGQEPH